MPKMIKPRDHAHWLELRSEDITSTESGALFDLSPYVTEFELYHRKKDKDLGIIEDNERMRWGRRLEDVIAQGVAEDMDIKVRRLKSYFRHSTVAGMGTSCDYEIINHPKGPGVMEIKNVDGLIFNQQWTQDEAPDHIEVQFQHQLEVLDRDWGLIVALVGGNQPVIIERERDREVGEGLCEAIETFWKRIAAGIEPTVDFMRDAQFINKLYSSAGHETLDAQDDVTLTNLLAEYKQISSDLRNVEAMKDAKKAEILMMIGDNYSKVLAGDGMTLNCGLTKGTPPTLITEDMVGKTIGGRQGYRQFRLNQKKQKEV